jgi:hypothetical protein
MYYARAVGAGLGVAAALGAIWAFIPFGGFFVFFISAAIGFGIGEAISYSVNRKRGRWLQVIAGSSVVVSYIVKEIIESPVIDFADMFTNVFGVIAVVLGIIIAASRL